MAKMHSLNNKIQECCLLTIEFRLEVALEPVALLEAETFADVLKRPIFRFTLPCGSVLSKKATSL